MSWNCSTSTESRPAELGEVVEDAAAADAAADDHRPCPLRYHAAEYPSFRRKGLGQIAESLLYSGACWPSEILELVPELRDGRARRAAARRAHEHELQGHGRQRAHTSYGSPARTRACSRSTARTRSTTRSPRPRSGVGARVVAYVPEHGALVLEFIEGRTQSAEDLRRGDKLRPRCGCVPAAARRAALPRRLQHVRRSSARYLEIVQERGFRLPERYLEFEPQVRAMEEAMLVRAEGTVPVQQRPAGRELHRRRRRASG